MFSFLQCYLATFPLILPNDLNVQVYCDNKDLVNRLSPAANQQILAAPYKMTTPLLERFKDTQDLAVACGTD